MFKSNVGPVDRVVRILLGIGLISLFFAYPNASWHYFALIGIVPILTAFVGSCPLYSVFGLSTCPFVSKG